MFLALDPGETTGWAFCGAEGHPLFLDPHPKYLGQVKGVEPLRRFLRRLEMVPKIIIYEEFRIRGDYARHFGQEHETIQNIGVIRSYWCDIVDMGFECKLVKQAAGCKDMGYGYGGFPKQSNHALSHQWDAMAHIEYYTVTNGIKKLRKRH